MNRLTLMGPKAFIYRTKGRHSLPLASATASSSFILSTSCQTCVVPVQPTCSCFGYRLFLSWSKMLATPRTTSPLGRMEEMRLVL